MELTTSHCVPSITRYNHVCDTQAPYLVTVVSLCSIDFVLTLNVIHGAVELHNGPFVTTAFCHISGQVWPLQATLHCNREVCLVRPSSHIACVTIIAHNL